LVQKKIWQNSSTVQKETGITSFQNICTQDFEMLIAVSVSR